MLFFAEPNLRLRSKASLFGSKLKHLRKESNHVEKLIEDRFEQIELESWNDSAIADTLGVADELVIPVIVLAEYRYGIAQSRHHARYRQWFDELISDCTILA